jgi:CheY-like chemotaxis protein
MGMPDYYDVALVGFSHSEYATFETFFRLVSSRRPKPFRATVQLASASMVMLSTNDTTDVERTLAAITAEQPLITVGVRRVANAWRHLERPINLNAVLMTVDAAIGAIAPNGASAAPVADLRPTPTIAIVPPQPMPSHSGANGHSAPVRTTSPPTSDRIAATLPEVAQTTTPRVAPMPPTAPLPARDAPMPRPTAPSRDLTPSSRVPATASASPQAGGVASPNVAARPPSPGVATAPASSVSRVSILVVDDSDVALKFIHGRLSAFGFHVDKCTSGEEALVRVSDGQYQFVFLDVMMEGLDGYQTCKAIKGRRYPSGHAPGATPILQNHSTRQRCLRYCSSTTPISATSSRR